MSGRFIPMTKLDVEVGRLRAFAITVRPDGCPAEKEFTTHIGAVSLARALRVLADRMEHPKWKGPVWSISPELAGED